MLEAIEHVILVDEHDQVLGYEEKITAHRLALLHRAFSVFLFRQVSGQWEVLLQQRAAQKYHCPGLWTNTCCSHPRRDETTLDAAHRRLFEEMGVQASLQYAGAFTYLAPLEHGLSEHEYDHVFISVMDANLDIDFNLGEVQAVAWVNFTQLESMLQTDKLTTPWLSQAFEIAHTHLLGEYPC